MGLKSRSTLALCLKILMCTFGTLCIKPRGHDIDYNFSPITFKLRVSVMDDERGTLLLSGHGVKGQGQLWHSLFKTI